MKRKLDFVKAENNPPLTKHRLLDMRNMEEYNTFQVTKYVFGVTDNQKFSVTPGPIKILLLY